MKNYGSATFSRQNSDLVCLVQRVSQSSETRKIMKRVILLRQWRETGHDLDNHPEMGQWIKGRNDGRMERIEEIRKIQRIDPILKLPTMIGIDNSIWRERIEEVLWLSGNSNGTINRILRVWVPAKLNFVLFSFSLSCFTFAFIDIHIHWLIFIDIYISRSIERYVKWNRRIEGWELNWSSLSHHYQIDRIAAPIERNHYIARNSLSAGICFDKNAGACRKRPFVRHSSDRFSTMSSGLWNQIICNATISSADHLIHRCYPPISMPSILDPHEIVYQNARSFFSLIPPALSLLDSNK